MPEDDVSLDDLIAIERVAQELWGKATKGHADRMAIAIRPTKQACVTVHG